MSKIAFFNHNNQVLTQVAPSIRTAVGNDDFVELCALNGYHTLENDKDVTICVFHQYPDNWNLTRLLNNRTKCLTVCSISSNQMARKVEAIVHNGLTHYQFNIPNLGAAGLLEGQQDELIERWRNFLSILEKVPFLSTHQTSVEVSPELDRFLNPNPESPLALRLLCEAYMLEPVGSSPQNGKSTVSGITVHCPEPKEWFSCFEAIPPKPPENGDASEIKRFDAELDAFANLMGDNRDEARALVKAIATESKNLKEEETLGSLIKAFAIQR